MIRGYAARASVWPGEQLVLHVSTGAGRFQVGIYRWSGWLEHVFTSGSMLGEEVRERGAAEDWRWPAYALTLPHGLPSGVYIAHLLEPGGAAAHLAMTEAAVLFVVRGSAYRGSAKCGSARGKLLYKIPLATYNAYNYAGGGCFYANPPRSARPPGAALSFRRPGCGIGGPTFGAPDHYDPGSPRQTFAHWDARFIRWLIQQAYAPEFCTDIDIHHDPGLLHDYRLLLSVGHDEYWSERMRDGVEDFIGKGGNVAFFSANLCWWRIHLVDGGAAMVCHQGGPQGALDHWWTPTGAGRPEDALGGVSYRHGGGWWDGPREAAGYFVQDAGHWAFAGTGLRQGGRFGANTTPPLPGYECDGAPLASFDRGTGIAALSPMSAACGTPPGFQLLAAAPLDDRWQELPHREVCLADSGVHAATMGIYTRGGTVFTAGTTDWTQVLGSSQDPRVGTITRNVIDRLMNAPPAHGSISHGSIGIDSERGTSAIPADARQNDGPGEAFACDPSLSQGVEAGKRA